jgi:hypothetical protein
MHFRRNIALALTGAVLAVPALTSCGFNYATDRVYTPAAGTNHQDASVDVLGAVIVSGQDDSGTFIASFANNAIDEEVSVESLSGGGGTTIQAESFEPIAIPPGGIVNLADEGGIPVTGTFSAGDFVPLTISFSNGERATLKVPVVPNEGDFADLDTSASSASPSDSASPSESASESPSESPAESPSASPSE